MDIKILYYKPYLWFIINLVTSSMFSLTALIKFLSDVLWAMPRTISPVFTSMNFISISIFHGVLTPCSMVSLKESPEMVSVASIELT